MNPTSRTHHQTQLVLGLFLLTLSACSDTTTSNPDGGGGSAAGSGATGGDGGSGGTGATSGSGGTGGDSGTGGTGATGGSGGTGATGGTGGDSGTGGVGATGGTGGTGGAGGTGGTGGTGGDAGTGGCDAPADCNDNIDCTADACDAGRCTNVIDATLCGASQVCDLRQGGCIASTPCGSDTDCADSDPCSRNETCNLSAAACKWDLLDGDADGHAPETCGGDDPDDADGATYPGAVDICDGKDNDGDGVVDTGTPCGGFCTSPEDSSVFEDPQFESTIRLCVYLNHGDTTCALDMRVVSDPCLACVELWLDCAEMCSGLPDREEKRLCECANGCAASLERCTGLDYPISCE